MAISITRAEIDPQPAKRGQAVKGTVEVQSDQRVTEVVAYGPGGEVHRLAPEGEGRFVASTTVPWDADPGTYSVTVVARSEGGEVARQGVNVTIA
jgi:hypothetical protein